MVDLTPTQIAGLERKTEELNPAIVQVNVAEANIVDRCESCHIGIREPLKLTAATFTPKDAKQPDDYAKAFVSHPSKELLQVHDPDKFGCSPCHQGNGRATTSIEKAHGNYEHWLWPLFVKQNVEAGCQTCHAADMTVGGALYLGLALNPLTGWLSLLTEFVYLAAYTPLKKIHPVCTFVGAFPGAMPGVLGWTAARGQLEWGALAMFAIVFFWQFPHFFSIAC